MTEDKQETKTKNTAGNITDAAAKGAPAAKRATEKNDGDNGDAAKDVLNKAKNAAGETATNIVGQAKEKATSLLGDQKNNLAAGIGAVADGIRQIGENLRGDGGENNQIASFATGYSDSLAKQVENFSHYVEKRDFKELAGDAEQFARRNPTLFIGGAFALGVLAARFLKSSGSRQTSQNGRRDGSKAGTAIQPS